MHFISRTCTLYLELALYISNLHSISWTCTLYFELAIFIDVWCMNFSVVGTKKKLLNTKVIIYHFFTIFIRNKAFTRRIFAWIPNWITSYTMTTRGLWISIPSSWKTSKSIQYRISFRFHLFYIQCISKSRITGKKSKEYSWILLTWTPSLSRDRENS